ncbi:MULTISPECIES: hypothetical protein [unclassified Bartonella]|nr:MULTISPECIES: hypothetical protein [unclassified Bartonella]
MTTPITTASIASSSYPIPAVGYALPRRDVSIKTATAAVKPQNA